MGILIGEVLKEKITAEDGLSPVSMPVTPVFDSAQLFNNSREVIIIHENTTYRLKKTRFGKLILNK